MLALENLFLTVAYCICIGLLLSLPFTAVALLRVRVSKGLVDDGTYRKLLLAAGTAVLTLPAGRLVVLLTNYQSYTIRDFYNLNPALFGLMSFFAMAGLLFLVEGISKPKAEPRKPFRRYR